MSPSAGPIRVLFVCTGNSCRSIFAEALLRQDGGVDFDVHSAGTDPKGLNAYALRTLDEAGIAHDWARSKSVTEYLGQTFDDVITVCDQARQICPVFPGIHKSLHWGFEDPADATGTDDEKMAVYRNVFTLMRAQIRSFIPVALRNREAADVGNGRRATG